MNGSPNVNGTAEGSRTIRWWLWIRYPLFVLSAIAFFVTVGIVAQPDEPWAEVKEFHAWWNSAEGSLGLSIKIKKNLDCLAVRVAKDMRLIQEGSASPPLPIVLEGELYEKVQRLAVDSEEVLADIARPHAVSRPISLVPGKYYVTLTMFCERTSENGPLTADDGVSVPASPQALNSDPARTTIIVTGPPVPLPQPPAFQGPRDTDADVF